LKRVLIVLPKENSKDLENKIAEEIPVLSAQILEVQKERV